MKVVGIVVLATIALCGCTSTDPIVKVHEGVILYQEAVDVNADPQYALFVRFNPPIAPEEGMVMCVVSKELYDQVELGDRYNCIVTTTADGQSSVSFRLVKW